MHIAYMVLSSRVLVILVVLAVVIYFCFYVLCRYSVVACISIYIVHICVIMHY